MSVTATPATDAARNTGGVDQHPQRPAPRQRMRLPFRGLQLWCLLATTCFGALLRMLQLGDWSVWVDEAHTWRDVTMPLDQFLGSARAWYPTSFLLLRWLCEGGWLGAIDEGSLRLPFALCGIVTVPLLALFGRAIVGGRAALLAALFLAINPWHVYWSQNARAYVLVCLFAVLAAGCHWLGIVRPSRRWRWLGVLLALVAGTCHVSGLLLLAVFAVHPLLAARSLAGRRAWGTAFALGLAVLLLPAVLERFPPFRTFQLARPDTAPSLLHLLQTAAFYFRVPLLCAAAAGLCTLWRGRERGSALFLACWAVLPLLLLGIIGATMVKVTARYALCALPAVTLLAAAASVRIGAAVAKGLGSGPRSSRWLPAAFLPVILLLDMAAYDYLYYRFQYGDRGRWREASRFVQQLAGARPISLYTTHEPVMMYYLRPDHYRSAAARRPATGVRVSSIERGDGDGSDYMQRAIARAQAQRRELFVAAAAPELVEKDVDGSLQQALRRDFELVEVLPCHVGPKDETIYIWRARR